MNLEPERYLNYIVSIKVLRSSANQNGAQKPRVRLVSSLF